MRRILTITLVLATGCGGAQRVGAFPAPAPAPLAAGVAPEVPAAQPDSGRLVRDTVRSRALAGNLLGQPATREVIVYLPPGYDRGDARFPTLYLLHRYDGRAEDWSNGLYQGFRIHEVMDSLVTWGEMPPSIVVMPDAEQGVLGSSYLNSEVLGNWEDFLAHELVAHVDSTYRTRSESGTRGIAGHSAGGYAALKLAMTHAEVFGSVYAMSPCCLAFGEELGELGPLAGLLGELLGVSGDEDSCAGTGPDSQVPILVVQACRENLRALEGIAIDVGDRDAFETNVPWARRFAEALEEAGVDHSFEAYPGGHTDRIGHRLLLRVLPFFRQTLRG